MPSFTSKLTQFCFSIAQKKKLNNLNDIEKYIAKHSSHKPKRKYYKQLNINEIKVNNFSCYVVKPKKNLNDKVIIYAHGGAFIIQILNVH
ncbi:hypothetical protein FACS189459_4740 [Bacilli bacterium]|nr:hypothetical protein FACS189459_4740 [Bacilli bacterium]